MQRIKSAFLQTDHSSLIGLSLIAVGIVFRIIPHPPNMTPITAIALLGGAKLGKKMGLFLPLAIMIISDYLLGFHSLILYTWGSFLIITLLSRYTLREKSKPRRLWGVTLTSSFLFFLITNFGVWAEGRMYAPTISGLLQSYTMALPFYRNAVIGDLAFTSLLFFTYAIADYTLHLIKIRLGTNLQLAS